MIARLQANYNLVMSGKYQVSQISFQEIKIMALSATDIGVAERGHPNYSQNSWCCKRKKTLNIPANLMATKELILSVHNRLGGMRKRSV